MGRASSDLSEGRSAPPQPARRLNKDEERAVKRLVQRLGIRPEKIHRWLLFGDEQYLAGWVRREVRAELASVREGRKSAR